MAREVFADIVGLGGTIIFRRNCTIGKTIYDSSFSHGSRGPQVTGDMAAF